MGSRDLHASQREKTSKSLVEGYWNSEVILMFAPYETYALVPIMRWFRSSPLSRKPNRLTRNNLPSNINVPQGCTQRVLQRNIGANGPCQMSRSNGQTLQLSLYISPGRSDPFRLHNNLTKKKDCAGICTSQHAYRRIARTQFATF